VADGEPSPNNPASVPVPVEAPRGFHTARVDDKGRLKLPAAFQTFLEAQPEQKVFVTKLRDNIARIYPIAIWRQNEALAEQYNDDADGSEDVLLYAQAMGADALMDNQGRVTLPQRLRQRLGLENVPVMVVYARGVINVYTEEEYEKLMQRLEVSVDEKLPPLRKKGFK
jgi:MraZ protein